MLTVTSQRFSTIKEQILYRTMNTGKDKLLIIIQP